MEQPYHRKTGDFEIRILPDGRLVFVAPDEEMMRLAQTLEKHDAEETVKDTLQGSKISHVNP